LRVFYTNRRNYRLFAKISENKAKILLVKVGRSGTAGIRLKY